MEVQATSKAVQTKSKAVQATRKAVQATRKAVQATSKAVQATSEAVQATGKAVQATRKVVQATSKAVQATSEAVQATGKAVQATSEAVQATGKAVAPTCREPKSEMLRTRTGLTVTPRDVARASGSSHSTSAPAWRDIARAVHALWQYMLAAVHVPPSTSLPMSCGTHCGQYTSRRRHVS